MAVLVVCVMSIRPSESAAFFLTVCFIARVSIPAGREGDDQGDCGLNDGVRGGDTHVLRWGSRTCSRAVRNLQSLKGKKSLDPVLTL